MDRLQAMQVFRRIVEVNSFSKAAETLGLPASTVTSIVQGLEAHLGVRLIQRTTRRLNLTSDGTIFYEHCLRILDEVDAVESSFPGVAGKPRGRLKVDAVTSLFKSVLLPCLSEFLEAYPDIELTLALSDRTVDLVQEGVDCALRTGALSDSSSLVGRQIGNFEWMTCASPAYVERYGEPADLPALSSHRTIGYTLSRTGRSLDWEFLENGNVEIYQPSGSLHINDAESYVACGVAGLGIIQAGSYLLQPLVEAGRLQPVLIGHGSPPVPVSLLYARNRHLSPTVRAFYEWVSAKFVDSPYFSTKATISRRR
ncbi:LysR family transcriptional regulator [Cupriavidus pauculus]|uniref:LysR family transcriptional regulator n=1 Tax=Cupriavidus pauculus TaxID=82633 RepID=UPI001FD0346A|nr:LysR family transcriptional regulator [Cupriavidus pauculus]